MSISSITCVRVRDVTLLSLVVLGLGGLLPACSTLAPGSKAMPPITSTCHSAEQCVVPVTVACGATSCTSSIPADKQVLATNGFAVVWAIAPGSEPYLFKNSGGIFFKAAQTVWRCHSEAHDTRYRCKSGHSDETGQEYGIELVGPKPVTILDPWIVNR